MDLTKDHFKNIVIPILSDYIKKENYNKENYNLVKKMVENLDTICNCFFTYIEKKKESDNYSDQLSSFLTITTCLENLVSLDYLQSEKFKETIKELLDFRNIEDFNKKTLYTKYVNKCLSVLIEYMIALNFLNRDQSHAYLKICEVGFVPI